MTNDTYEVWQGGMCVAKASGPGHLGRQDAMHYAMVYGQDGPVAVYLRLPNGKKKEVQL